MKEERLAVLRMLENGVISAEEAEKLLNALQDNGEKKDVSESINDALGKAGNIIEGIVGTVGKKAGKACEIVGDKVEIAKPEIKKAAKVVSERVSEAAATIKEDINKRKAEKNGACASDFEYDGEAYEKTEDAAVDDTAETVDTMGKEPVGETEATETNAAEEKNRTVEQEFDLRQIIPQAEEKDFVNEDSEAEDDRDYEAEFYQMMRETGGGDIFGDVYKAMDTLKSIEKCTVEPAEESVEEPVENDETNKE